MLAAAQLQEQARESDSPHDGRKLSAAVQQAIDRLPIDSADTEARILLAAAAEDTAWAWRMVQAAAATPALADAATVLTEHAAQCCDQAETLLAAVPSGEPRDGA